MSKEEKAKKLATEFRLRVPMCQEDVDDLTYRIYRLLVQEEKELKI